MAKVNQAASAKRASQGKQYRNGNVGPNGQYYSHYDQGYDAYFSRTKYSQAWHPHKQQGWRAARDSDILLLKQFVTAKASQSVMDRLNEMLELKAA